MKEKSPDKNTWYNWLINYIPEPIRKTVGGFRDKAVSLFKTNTPKKVHIWERRETKQTKNPKTILRKYY